MYTHTRNPVGKPSFIAENNFIELAASYVERKMQCGSSLSSRCYLSLTKTITNPTNYLERFESSTLHGSKSLATDFRFWHI
jgi:hypothetical protein